MASIQCSWLTDAHRAVASSIVRLVIFYQVGAILALHFNDETCKISRNPPS